jgi:hypothetical protein
MCCQEAAAVAVAVGLGAGAVHAGFAGAGGAVSPVWQTEAWRRMSGDSSVTTMLLAGMPATMLLAPAAGAPL